MDDGGINTYCKGFQLFVNRDITKKEFVSLCDNLQIQFNKYYNTDEYSFRPECITEGGIVFNNFNDRNKYKTMRLYYTDKDNITISSLYGYINSNIKEEWKDSDDVLIKKDNYLDSCLKSFRNAPKWTNEELLIFRELFESIGLSVKKVPKKKDLK